jgi:CubicO group peptidase (beta-lactamase class C family)
VLGYVVERVSGMRLDVFLQRRVFGPLKMEDSGFFGEAHSNSKQNPRPA